ncbi:MAG: transglutaminase-like cysteine peptidase [Sphingobium sp.]
MKVGTVADAPVGYVDMCRRDRALCQEMGGARSTALEDLRAAPGGTQIASAPAPTGKPARLAFAAQGAAGVDGQAAAVYASGAIGGGARTAADPKDMLKLLDQTNKRVNRQIMQISDYDIYGQGERWARPVGRGKAQGDCEDIAIEKRIRLLEAGVDPRDMSLAVVYSTQWGLHTVLVVSLSKGDYVLDNLNSYVRRWDKTSYVWLRVQSKENADEWLSVRI